MKTVETFVKFIIVARTLCLSMPVTQRQRQYSASSPSFSPSPSSSSSSSRDYVPSPLEGQPSSSESSLSSSGGSAQQAQQKAASLKGKAAMASDVQSQPDQFVSTIFMRSLRASKLTSSSTVSDIEEVSKEIMSRFNCNSNPVASASFNQYLIDIGVDEQTFTLYRKARTRQRNCVNKIRYRSGLKSRMYGKDNSTNKTQHKLAKIKENVQKQREVRAKAREVEWTVFKDKISNAGLHYDLDPYSYAIKDFPVREEVGARVYSHYQGRLQRSLGVEQSWKVAYRKSLRHLLYLRRRYGHEWVTKSRSRPPKWAIKYDIDGDATQDADEPLSDEGDAVLESLSSPRSTRQARKLTPPARLDLKGFQKGRRSGRLSNRGVTATTSSAQQEHSNSPTINVDLASQGQVKRASTQMTIASTSEPLEGPSLRRKAARSVRHPAKKFKGEASLKDASKDGDEQSVTSVRAQAPSHPSNSHPSSIEHDGDGGESLGRPTIGQKTYRGGRQEQFAQLRPVATRQSLPRIE